jgi:hypothetical protein
MNEQPLEEGYDPVGDRRPRDAGARRQKSAHT